MARVEQGKEVNQGILLNPVPKQNLSLSTSGINSRKNGIDNTGMGENDHARPTKKVKVEPLQPPAAVLLSSTALASKINVPQVGVVRHKSTSVMTETCKQFWKAGDYEGASSGDDWESYTGGSDHIRVHPRFLHSNATSHRWVLGAFAELLDNSLDEVMNGATFVSIDMIENKKNGEKMLVIEDNGGGMDPIKMRQCMSLGYSAKSKIANTIGQYGNGFKTSTMRLGADVIVFSRFCGKNGKSSTQSIGLLSYTFMRCTKKDDIEVPMLDYEKKGQNWCKTVKSVSSTSDWNEKVNAIVQWSPFSSEANLLEQFNGIQDHGTRVFIYNLWEDDKGELELDFDADAHDIQIRGVNRDEKNIQMAQQYPNSRHFLTYRHSLRSYASILYLRIPRSFKLILRGENIKHHNVVNDMMMTEKVTYRPQHRQNGALRDPNLVANVTVGFVKDAEAHIDVQGFNVYYKNRLIKPFWRVWHPAGSDGRGVIGVLEANFVEPAHDKQGFERTLVLSRLETKLAEMQRSYWTKNCHKIGYAPRQMKKSISNRDQASQATKVEMPVPLNVVGCIIENNNTLPSNSNSMHLNLNVDPKRHNMESKTSGREDDEPSNNDHDKGNADSLKSLPSKRLLHKEDTSQTAHSSPITMRRIDDHGPSNISSNRGNHTKILQKGGNIGVVRSSPMCRSSEDRMLNIDENHGNVHPQKPLPPNKLLEKCNPQIVHSTPHGCPALVEKNGGKPIEITPNIDSKSDNNGHGSSYSTEKLIEDNRVLRERLKMKEREFLGDLLKDLDEERNRRKSLEADVYQERKKCQDLEIQLEKAKRTIEQQQKDQNNLIDIFTDERKRRDSEEENLRKQLKDASNAIQKLGNRA